MTLKRLQRRLTRFLSIVVALVIVSQLGLYTYRTFLGYEYDSSLFEKDLAAGVQADENITNIALFGLDTREGDTQSHSDCMMIVTVDNTRGKIKLTSLMRDSLVSIEGYGDDKLNAAYFLGGPALAIKTINQSFGTDIQDYISVNFEQMVEIVEAIGGVEIDVQQTELEELNRVIRDYGVEQGKSFKTVESAGLQKLNGVQALCYGRIRKGGTGDDWGRVERQGIVLNALFTQVQDMRASKLLSLLNKLMPYITTSLSLSDLAPLVVGAVQDGVPVFEHARVPLDTEWNYYGSSGQYIQYDLDKAADRIYAYIYEDIFPGEGSAIVTDDEDEDDTSSSKSDDVSAPLGGVDYDEEPTAPAGSEDSSSDPSSLTEDGGSYDPTTGDYQDADGDYYYLTEDGSRVYYDQDSYRANLHS